MGGIPVITDVNEQVQQIPWLLSRFVEQTPGVSDAVCVSADGLLMAMSTNLDRAQADQFAAIAAGLTSLSLGASRCFGYGDVDQVMVEMTTGFLFVASISDGSCLGVLSSKDADVGLVGYEMTLLVDRFGAVLTPQVRAGLRHVLGSA
jgi:predicted regulator of Ras-like GTPase activity (Roadblock/LC7/MglB family)